MKHSIRSGLCLASGLVALLLLGGCGGGGIASTGTLPAGPSPTPTPMPTPADLVTLSKATSFQANAVTLDLHVTNYNGRLIGNALSATRDAVTVTYDPIQDAYTISSPKRSSTFGVSERVNEAPDGSGVSFSKESDTTSDSLLILRPGQDSEPNARYVAIGLWQTMRPGEPGEELVDIDPFVFGYASPASAIPRSGNAQFPVTLIGLQTTILDAPPSFVEGYGTFDVDFGRNVFRTSGEARLYSVFDGTENRTLRWDGSGPLSSSQNAFSGRFAFGDPENYRDEQMVGTLDGQFYGPQATQVGASATAKSIYETFGGVFAGTKSDNIQVPPFTVLPTGGNRAYEMRYSTFSYTRDDLTGSLLGTPSHSQPLEHGGMIITDPAVANANAGLLEFTADGAIAFVGNTLDAGIWPNFVNGDTQPGLSNTDFDAYEKSVGQTDDRLRLFRPGTANSTLALTYASFGIWEHMAQTSGHTDTTRTWFTYGVPTLADMVPRSGIGQYEGLMRGTGVSRVDGSEYALSGKAAFQIHFEGRGMDGIFEPVATPIGGAAHLPLASLSVSGAINRDNSFKGPIWANYTNSLPLEAGSWSGQLFGPRGEEAAGLIDFVAHDDSGGILADFAGAFVTKRTSGP